MGKVNYINLKPEQIDPGLLTLPKAIQCYLAINQNPFFNFVECLKAESGNEFIVFDTEVERGQYVLNDIRFSERIGIEFQADDENIPWVYALREDFLFVMHLNSREFSKPRCLCLYDETYDDLKLKWTPVAFLNRIREWLAKTAANELHPEDQPLEPLLIGSSGNVIIPSNVNDDDKLFLYLKSKVNNKYNLIASKAEQKELHGFSCHAISLTGKPQVHGIIEKTPLNFYELSSFLKKGQIDFVKEASKKLKKIKEEGGDLEYNLLLIVRLPKTRDDQSDFVVNDYYTFLTNDNIGSIGEKLDIWQKSPDGILGVVYTPNPQDDDLKNCGVSVLTPHTAFDRNKAAAFNDVEVSKINIVQIGVGALGSQIYMNMTRSGFGKWILIDDDILLPHNLARHAFFGFNQGDLKCEWAAKMGNDILHEENHAKYLSENFVNPRNSSAVLDALSNAQVILDTSASIAVARKLAEKDEASARRVSMFTNLTGKDLVVIAEDKYRIYTLDSLEMQYYGHLINNGELKGHLDSGKAAVRYTNSCRSLSSRIPQDFMALHASIASRILKKVVVKEEPLIGIWRIDDENMNVKHHEIAIASETRLKQDEWEIVYMNAIISKLSEARIAKLPNETGGVLVGSYDMHRKIIYVVDSILSPKDSEEYPNSYLRGIEGVKERLLAIENQTVGNLSYVGEWHSHPDNCGLEKSEDDKKQFEWIDEQLSSVGLPPLMLIMGGNEKFKFHTH